MQLLFAFQAASPGSRAFDAIIIELVAISIHQIAVILFSLDTRGHRDDGISTWAPPKTDDGFWLFYPDGPYPTLFSHSWYEGHERYPNGLADAVGYWAESCIFGGVVQFDRRAREVAPDADPDTLYLHPDRRKGTYRIFKVLPEQRKDLLRFLTSDVEPPPPNILPILATDQHAQRIDPEESSATTGIFRDIWERTEIPGDKGDARLRTMWDTVDYVTLDDKTAATRRAKARRWRHDYPDDPDGYWRNFLE
jgi:hypothetical protein